MTQHLRVQHHPRLRPRLPLFNRCKVAPRALRILTRAHCWLCLARQTLGWSPTQSLPSPKGRTRSGLRIFSYLNLNWMRWIEILPKLFPWWNQQPDSAGNTISRVIAGMGMEPHKMKPNTSYELLLRMMTVALTCSSWLSEMLRSNCLKAKQIRAILPNAHSCIVCLALLTPFTLYPSTELFHVCRIFQTLLMGQYVLSSPAGSKKLKALLKGTFLRRLFQFSSFDDLVLLTRSFFR